jgi:DNA-binding winged helix-turn-helix (wHTH) protein
LQIADWQVLPDRLLVRRGDEEHALEPRLMEVLIQLALRPGVVVARQDLLHEVWGETVVQEEALTQAVSQIRRILGDDPRRPTLIETVPKRGYRLLAPVTPLPSNTDTTDEGPRRFPRRLVAFVAVLGIGLVLGVAFWPSSQPTDPQAEFWDARPLTSLESNLCQPFG